MVKFLVYDVFALPNELVITGTPQDGVIGVGMKCSVSTETLTINKIELNRKMLTESPQGTLVGLHTNRLKSMKAEGALGKTIVDFSQGQLNCQN